jgi:hemolysin III
LPAAVEAATRYHAGGMSLSVATPRLRGRIHQVAFFVSIPMGITVVLLASGAAATAVAAVYAASLTAVFGTSAAYHRGRWGPRARRWMKRLDHSMIYVLIAGSYTPVAVLALHGPWEVVLLSVAWAGAAVGITMKMARPDGLSVLSAILYMAMGWLALVAIPPLVRGMPPAGLVLMVAGGLLYTAGAIVFASRRPDPRPAVFGYHEIWHAFMVAAAACHYVMILLVLRAS